MIKINFGWAPLMIVALLIGFVSCEQEDKYVGANVVGDSAAQFHKTYVDLVATTLTPDTLRSDRKILQNATIGVYDEPLFGKTKSYYYTQVRLGTTNPDFGTDAVVDSVILSIPVFTNTSDTIAIEHYLEQTKFTLGNTEDSGCTITDTADYFKTRFKFEIDSLYGNRDTPMTLQVHRVVDDLGTIDSTTYSDRSYQVGELFGSKQITDEAWRNFTIKYSSLDAKQDSTIQSQDNSAVINVNLEGMKSFVQQNIVDQAGSSNLGDQISFINNVLKGIRIGVADENGFIFTFKPTGLKLNAYISSNNTNFVDENGNNIDDDEEACPISVTQPRTSKVLNFVIGSDLSLREGGIKYYNVTHNEIINTQGSITYNQQNAAVNYVEGMGGAKVKLSLDPVQLEAIKDSVRNNNWVITEAHFKIFPDENTQGNLPIPDYLYAYNYTEKTLLPDYGSPNDSEIQAFPYQQISRPYSENGYYLLRVTEFIKNIVEKEEPVDDLAIEMGSYLGFDNTFYFYSPRNAYFSDRVFNPYRLAIVGTNPTANQIDKKLQLEIFYNKRQN